MEDRKKSIPRGIWALGLVSLFMDSSSELIHSLLPLFMVTVLHASMTSVGLIEGIAEATALITKIFSGYLSDSIGKRKLPVVLGYGIAALSKPLFPLAKTLDLVLLARFIDRIGKGIRGAPRDALIAEISPPEIRGACFGLRQALDTVGAVLGPLLAMLLMFYFNNEIRSCLWVAVFPAFISVALLIFGVKEPEHPRSPKEKFQRISIQELKMAGPSFWHLVGIGLFVTLARFSEAFLLLKTQAIGLTLAYIPLVLVAMNIAYAASSYPAGWLSDRRSRKVVLSAGLLFLCVADILLAFSETYWVVFAGILLWGLHMGFSQGLLASMVADTASPRIRGSAFGIFHFVSGIALFFASFLAGYLWDAYGAAATFLAGCAFSLIALALLFSWEPPRYHPLDTSQ